MNTVEKLTADLGPPRALRVIASGRHLVAAVGRWRHQGAQVDLGVTGTVQLVFNVSGGQLIEKIDAFVAAYNRTAKPFAWTATAKSIFSKFERLLSRISGTQTSSLLKNEGSDARV